VILDFDGVMFDMQAALEEGREHAISDLPDRREHRPRPLAIWFSWAGIHQTLAFLAGCEPDYAVEAEALTSELELDAALTAGPARSLNQLLSACAAAGRRVAVISDLSEHAVLAAIGAHTLDTRISAAVARQGLDLSVVDAGHAVDGRPRCSAYRLIPAWLSAAISSGCGLPSNGCYRRGL
jgi:beta-phosphoglucomutase-like phosphatase (HAD superfamily)